MPTPPNGPRPRVRLPKYRHHKTSGRASVEIGGRVYWLGPHGTEESRQKYDRLVAEWLAGNRAAPDAKKRPDVTVNELILRFWRYAEDFYRRPDGSPTGEGNNYRVALRALKALYGFTPASDFSPRGLKAVRQRMIGMNWTRRYINRQIGRLKYVFHWAVGEELVDEGVHRRLLAVKGLRKGKTEAREKPKVKRVPQAQVDATLPFLPPAVQAMVRLQLVTGMRPGEVRTMRPVDIDASDPKLWVYKPEQHKTEHHDIERAIYLGPQARQIVEPFITDRPVHAYLFSPKEDTAWRYARAKTHRRPKQKPNPKKSTRRIVEHYGKDSYIQTVGRACDKAFPPPEPLARREGENDAGWHRRLTAEQRAELKAWRKEHRWRPNQLRHSAATRLRKQYGLDAARIILGHTTGATTEIYAEQDVQKAREIMTAVG